MQDPNLTSVLSIKDEMSQGLAKIQQSLQGLTDQFKQAGQQVGKSMTQASGAVHQAGKEINGALASIQKENLKTIEKFTKMTARIAGMQAGLASLGNVAGQSGAEMSKGFRVASNSLNTFASVVAFMPTPLGAAAGAIGALMTAMVQLVDTVEGRAFLGLIDPDVEKKFKAMNDRTAKLRVELTALDDAWKKLGVSLDLTSRDKLDTARAQFSALQAQALKLHEVLPNLKDELTGAVNALKGQALNRDRSLVEQLGLAVSDGDTAGIQRLMFRLQELNQSVGGTDGIREAISQVIQSFMNWQNVANRLGVALSGLRDQEIKLTNLEVEKLTQNFDTLALIGAESVKFGLQTPLEAASAEAAQAKANVTALLQLIQRLKNANVADPETKKQLEGLATSLERSTLSQFVGKAQETEELRKQREEYERIQKILRANDLKLAWSDGLREFIEQGKTLKDTFKDAFQIIEDAGADAFQVLLGHGKRFGRDMRSILKEIGNAFKRLASDFLSSTFTRSALSLLPGAVGLPGMMQGPGGAQPMAGPGAVNPLQGLMGLGGMAAASGAGTAAATGAFGLSSLSLLGLAGGIGLTAASGQMKSPAAGAGMGALGGVLSGLAVAGPVGALVGGLGGLLFGFGSSSKQKAEAAKEKEAIQEAEEEAREALAAQMKLAKSVVTDQVRFSLGGGNLDPRAIAGVSDLFSGGISDAEITAMGGVEQILAQGSMARYAEGAAAQKVVNVGGITVHATVGASYDIQELAQDLGWYVQTQFAGL